jgi:Zn-dependent M28 family amino/carboxypeptidase
MLVNDVGGLRLKDVETRGSAEVRIRVSKREREVVNSENVVGVLEGQDPELNREWVAITAHFDHLGSGRDLPGATDEDQIFNGARDNGMGTVALLTAAETLGALRPARSIILIALNGEELGMLGSRYYVEHPLIPLERTVFVLNADGGGYEDTSLATVLGLDRTSEGTRIRRACEEFGINAIPGGEALQHFFNQSDNVNFARRGIPAPTFSPGFREFGAAIRRFYHQPADEADENFDFDYLLRYSQAFALAARYIADDRETPRWTPGDEYENARSDPREP